MTDKEKFQVIADRIKNNAEITHSYRNYNEYTICNDYGCWLTYRDEEEPFVWYLEETQVLGNGKYKDSFSWNFYLDDFDMDEFEQFVYGFDSLFEDLFENTEND